MLKREHDRAVMNALDVFRKSEIAKSQAQLTIKMTTTNNNRETYLHEVRKRCREKDKKRKAAAESKKVKPLRPPPWPEEK